MKNKLIKYITSLLVAIVLCSTIFTTVGYALDDPSKIQPKDDAGITGDFSKIGGMILGAAQVIGVAVAIIILLVLGIKYMTAAPNDKAEIKKHAVVYIVGAVVLFGASGILALISNFAKSIQAS